MSVVLNPFSLIVRKIAETEFRLKNRRQPDYAPRWGLKELRLFDEQL